MNSAESIESKIRELKNQVNELERKILKGFLI